MERTASGQPTAKPSQQLISSDEGQLTQFPQQWVTITKQEEIELRYQASYYKALHTRSKNKIRDLEQENLLKDARIKDLQSRLFGKKSEKSKVAKSGKGNGTPKSNRSRGQQPGSQGHGRTQRSNLPIIDDEIDLSDDNKKCPSCGLPHRRNSALDETSNVVEVEVSAYTRRYNRPAYTRNPGCSCDDTPAIITAPPPPRLIPRSDYGISFWVEIILSKYCYGQPTNRHLQDLSDQGLPVSPGTVAGGLQRIALLFKPLLEVLRLKQMTESLFHNDETRWEVFVEIEGKVGTRWYLWVSQSKSVVFYCIDPSRSAAVPGAHFAGLHNGRVIIVCDRYSAYKKLARLTDNIFLAFCWVHVRRDFLEAGRAFPELEAWALNWKERIGQLYHFNKQRLEQWRSEFPLSEQSDAFNQHHQALNDTLQRMHDEATRIVNPDATDTKAGELAARKNGNKASKKLSTAQTKQKKVLTSLLNHWSGLILFVEQPEIPMDNNKAESSIRGPVTGRKNYYGSGSIWSAQLAAALFSIMQTLGLWGINRRSWLMCYLTACAQNGGQTPQNIDSFLPWLMDEEQRAELTRPCSAYPPIKPTKPVPINDSS